MDLAIRFKQVYSTYQQNRDLVSVGAYRRGSDPRIDHAIDMWPKLLEFLRQDMYEAVPLHVARDQLRALVGGAPRPA
jgi:flagellum-specific ATP synthase